MYRNKPNRMGRNHGGSCPVPFLQFPLFQALYIGNMFANICIICSRVRFPATVPWRWRKRYCTLQPFSLRRFCWGYVRALKGNSLQTMGYAGPAPFGDLFLNGIRLVAKVKNNMINSLMSIAGKIPHKKEPWLKQPIMDWRTSRRQNTPGAALSATS